MTAIVFGPGGAFAKDRSDELRDLGHLLSVTLSGKDASESCQALIDTGASHVCIDYRVAERLGLTSIDERRVGVVGGSATATVYMGRLSVEALGHAEFVELYALKLARPTHQVLLGRTFLQPFTVTLDGPDGRFAIARPRRGLEPFDE